MNPTTPTPPPGGFQQGGWYNGQQYWNGTLSTPGVINSQSNQQGAGKAVSDETITQTNPNNVAYIQGLQKKANITPTFDNNGAGGSNINIPGSTTAASIDLPAMYQSLYKSAGIDKLEENLTNKEKSYNDAMSQINDNPFLSEASRLGKQQKLTIDYNNDIANDKNTLATKKADIETQLNLQSKQYDINSQASKDAISQFNTLLSSGALDNVTSDDIANLTRSTGMSSAMIQAAIKSNKDKSAQTSTISFDDGVNQGFAIINPKTGDIISKQNVSKSKPSTTVDNKSIITNINRDYSDYINNSTITIKGKTGPAQALISPDDFYKLMIKNYPSNVGDIQKPEDIRKITGQD